MRSALSSIGLLILAINTLWFVVYSAQLGVQGLLSDSPSDVSRVFLTDSIVANVALAGHMLAGAVLTIGAPLQALPILRNRWPRLHRRSGYGLLTAAVVTGVGGLVYIASVGTIGGAWMDFGFALYGAAILFAAIKTVSHAVARQRRSHFEWAVRLVVLAVGSWIYRMHYAIWYGLTGGVASNETFNGAFDRVQVLAFFVPYLVIAEVCLRLRRRNRTKAAVA
ncbi:MAG: DUF2306 domain-containing protein [Marivita sp.]|uniref:DUF2306 domain-containing protein n=1 Tax=Marivita sp. TaxID=2003365 RepID=UPI001B20A13D|nr:DUF2306 domain-containing protein [Marivita sp.]MBO6884136.1 DUF2306 domain-containing protein [Marivita sp.]